MIKKLCCSYKIIKTSIKSWANVKETKPNEYNDYFLNELAIIRRSFEPVNFYELIYNFKDSSISSVKFMKFKDPNAIFKDMHDGNITLENVENEQKNLK